MTQIQAIESAWNLWTYRNSEHYDMTKLSAAELQLIADLESEIDEEAGV